MAGVLHAPHYADILSSLQASAESAISGVSKEPPEARTAKADILAPVSVSSDTDLQNLLRIWPQVPASVRAAILAILEAVSSK
jgi:hypothetical protein